MNKLLKYISYVKEIARGHVMHKNIPVMATLCLTNRCNLRCTYCYEEYYDRNHSEFTTKEILTLIDELYEMGTKYISINGGEVLLRKDIDIIVDKIKEKNMLCHISTNGLLVKKHISALKKADSISISIDGDRESNDLNRGNGTYDKIIEGFECLKENNIKFHSHTVLTKNNLNAVDEMMDIASKYGFKAQFSLLRHEDSYDKQVNLSDDEVKTAFKKILEYMKSGYPVFFSADSYRNALNWPFTYEKQRIFGKKMSTHNSMKCYTKKFSCHIEANGLVYPCVVLVNKFKALNFLEVGFEKAWANLESCDCKACYNICLNDLNRMFELKPVAIWNSFKIVVDRIAHKIK